MSVDGQCLAGAPFPGESFSVLSRLRQRAGRHLKGTVDTIGNGFHIIWIHAYCQPTANFGRSTSGTRQDRCATRHGFQNGHTKAFIEGGKHETPSACVQGWQVLVWHVAHELHALTKSTLLHDLKRILAAVRHGPDED